MPVSDTIVRQFPVDSIPSYDDTYWGDIAPGYDSLAWDQSVTGNRSSSAFGSFIDTLLNKGSDVLTAAANKKIQDMGQYPPGMKPGQLSPSQAQQVAYATASEQVTINAYMPLILIGAILFIATR